jgi:tyrosyl-DNA phosphodiesterase-1
MAQQEAGDPPTKRRKLNADVATTEHKNNVSKGLDKPISPPLSRRRSPERASEPTWSFDDVPKPTLASRPLATASKREEPPAPASIPDERPASERASNEGPLIIPSPVQLTRIAGLGSHQNVDAVGLGDLLGDPLIKECWNFNFLFDIDFVMYADTSMSLYTQDYKLLTIP